MSSLIITINSPLAKGTLKDQVAKGATLGEESLAGLINHLSGVSAGVYPAAVTFGVSATDPVRASGTMTIVFGTLAATHTVTVAGTVLTCVTTTPAANEFQKLTDGTVTATNLAAAINASAAINRVSATSSGAVVTVTAHQAGTVGNLIPLVSSAGGVTLSGALLTTGAGDADEAPVAYSFGR